MELAELAHLAGVRTMVVRARNLHHRRELLERRVREERAEAFAHLEKIDLSQNYISEEMRALVEKYWPWLLDRLPPRTLH